MSRRAGGALLVALLAARRAAAQTAEAAPAAREPRPIQDNSFLIEEAYNQDPNVVQHIQQFVWSPTTGSWLYTFTEEWPVGGVRHQLSYTLALARVSDAGGATGLGDLALNYRYQVVGDSDAPLAMAPRISVLLPTGNARRKLGVGGAGVQLNVPVSIVLSPSLQANANAGGTWIPSAKDERGDRAHTVAYAFGSSLIWRTSATCDLLVEGLWAHTETPVSPRKAHGESGAAILPGVRWAYNFPSGLQIVPGIGVLVGIGPHHDRSALLYLSFEHPIGESR